MDITIFINDNYYGSVESSYHLSKVLDELTILTVIMTQMFKAVVFTLI